MKANDFEGDTGGGGGIEFAPRYLSSSLDIWGPGKPAAKFLAISCGLIVSRPSSLKRT